MKKILVVDDEQDLCVLVKKSLEQTGKYSVVTTSLPEDVIRICVSERPDLILLDIVMPNVDGNELIEALRQNPKTSEILIIVTSGLGEMVYFEKADKWRWLPNREVVQKRRVVVNEKDAHRAASAYGVDDFIAKPFSPSTLKMVVEEVFSREEKKGIDREKGSEEH